MNSTTCALVCSSARRAISSRAAIVSRHARLVRDMQCEITMNETRRLNGLARMRMTPLIAAFALQMVSSRADAEETSSSATEVTVDVAEPAYDGYQSLLDWEAHVALAKGDFPRAWHFFWRLLQIDPY